MSSSSGSKRVRTVDGSCWPCRQRRVICDLTKPNCKKCAKVGVKCNFEERLLKWQNSVASRGRLSGKTQPVLEPPPSNPTPLRIAERRSLDYFAHDFWPLLLVGHDANPAPSPISSSILDCRPLLLAICAVSTKHHDMRMGIEERGKEMRLACVSSLRGHLATGTTSAKVSTAMMLTAIFLCVLDGYIAPQDELASTSGHQLGAKALIDVLGGPHNAISKLHGGELTLFSEFCSMDLTRAVIHGGIPYLPYELWSSFGSSSWYGDLGGPESLGRIFAEFSKLAVYVHTTGDNSELMNMDDIRRFELDLQPPREVISSPDFDIKPCVDTEIDLRNIQAQALCRSFRHCAYIYLYRAICHFPAAHSWVQREVQMCLDCISSLGPQDKFQNCALFPLCIAGAHSLVEEQRQMITANLDIIAKDLGFGNVKWLQASLEKIWVPGGQDGDWKSLFQDFSQNLFVL